MRTKSDEGSGEVLAARRRSCQCATNRSTTVTGHEQSERGEIAMAGLERKSFDDPDETRPFQDKGQVEIVNIGGGVVGRATFQPGWKWSDHVKPIAGTDS